MQAWLEYLEACGTHDVILLGHSLGAIKAVYLMAHRPHPAVKAVVAVSPARLSYAHFVKSERAKRFEELLARAQELVAQGEGETLLEVDFPLPYLVSAASYVDKYGPTGRYDVLELLDRVEVPQLYTFGTEELGHVAFAGLPEAIKARSPRRRVQVEVLSGADHHYQGCLDLLAQKVLTWVDCL